MDEARQADDSAVSVSRLAAVHFSAPNPGRARVIGRPPREERFGFELQWQSDVPVFGIGCCEHSRLSACRTVLSDDCPAKPGGRLGCSPGYLIMHRLTDPARPNPALVKGGSDRKGHSHHSQTARDPGMPVATADRSRVNMSHQRVSRDVAGRSLCHFLLSPRLRSPAFVVRLASLISRWVIAT
jgi:hypothetical protein